MIEIRGEGVAVAEGMYIQGKEIPVYPMGTNDCSEPKKNPVPITRGFLDDVVSAMKKHGVIKLGSRLELEK